jgi:hypothetical protein
LSPGSRIAARHPTAATRYDDGRLDNPIVAVHPRHDRTVPHRTFGRVHAPATFDGWLTVARFVPSAL